MWRSIVSTITGLTPAVGSSSRTSRGSPISSDGELEQLALPERERAGAVVRDARQAEVLEQRVGRAPARRVRAPAAGATATAAATATARFSSTVSSENTRALLERAGEPGAREPRRVRPAHGAAREA